MYNTTLQTLECCASNKVAAEAFGLLLFGAGFKIDDAQSAGLPSFSLFSGSGQIREVRSLGRGQESLLGIARETACRGARKKEWGVASSSVFPCC